MVPWFIPSILFEYKIKFVEIFKLFVTLRWLSERRVNFCFKLYKTVNIFWLILAPFENVIINVSKNPIPLKAPELVMCACFGLIHLLHTESDSASTESTRSETPRKLSQRRRHQHLKRFYHSALTQLTWSLTPHWLKWRGVSLGVDSVDGEKDSVSTESLPTVKNLIKSANLRTKLKKIQKLYYLAYLCLVSAKNENKKISCKCTFKPDVFL